MAGAVPPASVAMMMDHICRPTCSASTTRLRPGAEVHHQPQLRSRAARARPGLQGVLERPKSLDPHDEWEPVELTLFRSTEFGDDQDRPVKKSDGSWTYFGGDLAYHFQKAQQADQLIDISGADDAGTVKRIKRGRGADRRQGPVRRQLVQMVRLLRAGEPVKMSKRSGNFVTLADVVNEVGKDVVRFTMLTRKADAQMDFDFAKVVEASKDNPVFYVQYAHAHSPLGRIPGQFDMAAPADLSRLDEDELGLVRSRRSSRGSSKRRRPRRAAPHRLHLGDLGSGFHAQWNKGMTIRKSVS